NKDFTTIAAKYNGPGNVQYYSKLLQDNYNHLVPKGDIEEVEELPVNEDQYKELTDRINALTAKVQTLEVTNGTAIEQLIKGIETQRATINNLTQQIANLTEFTITLSKALTELEVPNTDTPAQINFNYSESLTDFIGTVITVNQGTHWKVKDMFTNQDGSWDVSDKPFSIDHSFRDKYLKPVNDKEYISTGDHSITVVTVDKDGNRLGNIPIEFKSNGNPPIIVNRNTKEGSGYENLILYSGQNMSEEKEGPWTTTVGDASVSGLGLYQNWHISIVIVFERQN
ncbi:MAG: hypothetical protein KDH96_13375, partial [Candidatus Riesia sp.]|nr:hypothetical protein [Candidatus Riesia sp.]